MPPARKQLATTVTRFAAPEGARDATPAKVARVVSDKWFVRVDGPESFLATKCRELSGWIDADKVFGVYHTGKTKENPHCHMLIAMTSILQKQSFDVRIKKLFEIDKKTQYSTKVWDGNYGEGAGSYLYHESDDPPILVNKGFTELHIQGFKDANALVQRVMAQANEKANTKLIEKALAEFSTTSMDNNKILEWEVFKYMLQCIKNGENYHPGEFNLMKYVAEVVLRLSNAQQFEDYAWTRYQKLFLR